ncbi:MAG TPA: Rne/Rng family ribonuclease [Candidatus Brocadiia bacterium]|nr:Rne/Rng family ribonuclease [Candidatus Brocadiia bacterium]
MERSDKVMLINCIEPEECRIAVLENKVLDEFYIERTSRDHIVGNIYKGRVVNLEPSIEAAFVDFGYSRNGFLHISDVKFSAVMENNSHRGDHVPRHQRRITDVLRNGQEIMVQVTKEGVGNKGPALTTYLSVPGRFLVMMPDFHRRGVSRKVEDDELRHKLMARLQELSPPPEHGFIIRTAGADETKKELKRDLDYLVRLWSSLEANVQKNKAPYMAYEESDLVIRAIRDVFSSEIKTIFIDSEPVYHKALDFMNTVMPQYHRRLQFYREDTPLFHRYRVEEEIDRIYARKIDLPSGGSIVIEQTEALVAIDVNSGRYKEESGAEETAFRTNIEAAREIPRQLRLRDLGGVVINDFIDMLGEKHQRDVENELWSGLRKDRARVKMLRMSKFGTIELTRQRMRSSVGAAAHLPCPMCKGAGFVKSLETVALGLIRNIRFMLGRKDIERVELHCNHELAQLLFNHRRESFVEMERRSKKNITIMVNPATPLAESQIVGYRGDGRKEIL